MVDLLAAVARHNAIQDAPPALFARNDEQNLRPDVVSAPGSLRDSFWMQGIDNRGPRCARREQ